MCKFSEYNAKTKVSKCFIAIFNNGALVSAHQNRPSEH